MKGNRFVYYVREGINSIFNHGFMSFASVCIIVACLIIMGSFTLLALNVDSIINSMESENEIMAFVDESYSTDEAQSIKPGLEAIDNVSSVIFVTREQAWDDFLDTYSDPGRLGELGPETLRDRYVIYVDDISIIAATRDAVSHVDGIADTTVHLDIAKTLVKIRNIVTIASIALVAILFTISLFIMANTIKLTTFERRDEIAIMKMVGATSTFIRWPFVVQGLILGLLGSLLSFVMEWGLYTLFSDKLMAGAELSLLTVIPFSVVSIPIFIAFTVVGLGVGVIGSLLAIKNYLKV